MPYLSANEFGERFSLARRDVARMIIDEGLPTERGPHGLLIDEDEATEWMEENGYTIEDLDDEDEESETQSEDEDEESDED